MPRSLTFSVMFESEPEQSFTILPCRCGSLELRVTRHPTDMTLRMSGLTIACLDCGVIATSYAPVPISVPAFVKLWNAEAE